MTKEIGINMGVFSSNISKLRSSVSALDGSIKKDWTYNKTNISPLTNDLENTIRAMELLKRYISLMEADINTLEIIGERLQEIDDRLGDQIESMPNNPQPIR
ncbi:TIGR04197 family type VII secretion effector [Lentibacillus jeotgali]|uniref:TIGR04197 family type VII secretion effector n=1 Tax=Lentibacillus jeotgali TaxID=558169 RepID=UPI0002627481|nr:TIGR04197 family type VII secretion effector [Lentibacillus jeotgali]